jgi:hypothetical protein
MKYNLTDDLIQQIIISVAGNGKKEITWDQFNAFITAKVERNNNSI